MSTLDIALAYLDKHPTHYLFPMHREKGAPHIKDNLAQASNDPKQIKKWHVRWPGCWWGLSLKKSGLIALDFDVGTGKVGKRTYETLRDELKAAGDPLMPTLIHQSPSGGFHLIYKGQHHFSASKLGKNCDTPNYVVIPGCTKADGRTYSVLVDKPIAAAPATIIERIKPRKSQPPRTYSGDPIPVDIFTRMLADTPHKGGPKGMDDRHSYQGWLNILMAMHEAACGDGADYLWAAAEWSLSDPEADPAWSFEQIERHWHSFTAEPTDKLSMVTRASWFKVLEHFGHHYVAEIEAREGADALRDNVEDDPLPPPPPKDNGKRRDRDDVLKLIETLENTSGRTPDETATFKAKAKELIEKYNITEQDREDYRQREKQSDGLDTGLGALLRAWAYIKQHKVWVRRVDSMIFDKEAFDLGFRNVVPGVSSLSKYLLGLPDGAPWRPQVFDTFCFLPGQPENVHGNFNQWVEPDIKAARNEALARVYFEHIAYLLADESERDLLLDWLAWVYRYPEQHPLHALLFHGEHQGTGKSTLTKVQSRLMGPINPVTGIPFNTTLLNQTALEDLSHNGWAMRSKLNVIEEVRPAFSTQRDANSVAKQLHALISEDSVHIDEKFLRPFDMGNVMAFAQYSNQKNALAVDNTDRRNLMLSCDAHRKAPLAPREKEYYRMLWGTNGVGGKLNDPAVLAAIAWELQHRDLKGYTGRDRAPWTQAKADMQLATSSDLERYMVEHRDDAPYSYSLVSIPEIMEDLPGDVMPPRGARELIAAVLTRRFGGENIGKVRLGGRSGGQPRLWAINKPKADAGVSWREKYNDAALAAIYQREHYQPTPAEREAARKAAREAVADFAGEAE